MLTKSTSCHCGLYPSEYQDNKQVRPASPPRSETCYNNA